MPVSTPVVLQHPQRTSHLYGFSNEDAVDWIDHYERVAALTIWDDHDKFQYVFVALRNAARTWFDNRQASITS